MRYFAILFITSTLFAFTTDKSTDNKDVNWITVEEAYAKIKDEPRPILIDVYTDWCGWCKRMDATTYSNPEIIEYLNNNFYTVKFNAEQKEDITVMGQTFKFVAQGKRGYHELAAALLNGKMSYPSTVFLTDGFQVIQPIPGYLDAKGIEPILHFFSNKNYEKIAWESFQKDFKSQLE